nr:hypothetical protein [Candidatus Sigynarchaeota archaeon]
KITVAYQQTGSFSGETVLEFSSTVTASSGYPNSMMIGFTNKDRKYTDCWNITNKGSLYARQQDSWLHYRNMTHSDIYTEAAPSDTNFHEFRMEATSSAVRWYRDDTSIKNVSGDNTPAGYHFSVLQQVDDTQIDWVRVRKYQATSITASIGSETATTLFESSNWATYTNGSCSVNISSDGGNNSLLFNDVSANGIALASWHIPGTCPSSCIVTFAFNASDTTQATYICLADGPWTNTNRHIAVSLKIENGSLYWQSNSSWTNIATITANQWHTFEIHYYIANHTWYVRLDGARCPPGSGTYAFKDNAAAITHFEVSTDNTDSNYHCLLDDIVVDVEP